MNRQRWFHYKRLQTINSEALRFTRIHHSFAFQLLSYLAGYQGQICVRAACPWEALYRVASPVSLMRKHPRYGGLQEKHASATCRASNRRRGLAGGILEAEDPGHVWFHWSRHPGGGTVLHALSSCLPRPDPNRGETTVCLHGRRAASLWSSAA